MRRIWGTLTIIAPPMMPVDWIGSTLGSEGESRVCLRIFSKSSGEERGFGGNSRVSHQAFADGEFDAVGGGHGAGEDAEHLAGAPLDGKSHVVLRRASGAVNSARSMEKIRPLQTVLQRPTALRYQASRNPQI
jgi:hypothetical protein